MGAADELILKAEGADDLGGTGDQRNDPRHPELQRRAGGVSPPRACPRGAHAPRSPGYTMPQRRRRNHSRASTCTNSRKNATRNGERPLVVRQSGNFDGRGGGFGSGFDGIDSSSRTSSPGRR